MKQEDKLKISVGKLNKAYDDFPAKDQITKIYFYEVVKTFFALMIESIINTGVTYKIPYGIGLIGVTKNKPYWSTLLDWKSTKANNGELTYFTDTSTDGLRPKFFWRKRRCDGATFTFTDVWRLRWPRSTKRLLMHEALQNNKIIKYY